MGPRFSLFVLVMMLAAIGYLLWSKKQAGPVLLSLGRSRTHRILLFSAVLLILVSIVELVGFLVESGTELDEVLRSLGLLVFGVFLLLSGWSGSQIREAGILSVGQLLKWERIESYEWGEKTLYVVPRRRSGWSKPVSFPVPSLHRDAVSDLLAQHVSGATV